MTSSRQRRKKSAKKEPLWPRCLFVLRVIRTRWLSQSVRNIFINWLDGQQFNDSYLHVTRYNLCGGRKACIMAVVVDLVAGRMW